MRASVSHKQLTAIAGQVFVLHFLSAFLVSSSHSEETSQVNVCVQLYAANESILFRSAIVRIEHEVSFTKTKYCVFEC